MKRYKNNLPTSIPTYSYIASTEFINSLKFDYIETYSFQRGIEFEKEANTICKSKIILLDYV